MSGAYGNAPGTPKEVTIEGTSSGPSTPANNAYEQEWTEISHGELYVPRPEDVGRKLKLEAAAYSSESGELLMHRVVKTDLVLSRTPEPDKRNFITKSAAPGSAGGARFRVATYNILAEIYATQQQYPYADLWSLSWDFR